MSFVWEQLQQLGMVAIIMICALGGTVGILKLIKRFAPGKDFLKGPAAEKPEGNGQKLNGEDYLISKKLKEKGKDMRD